MGFGSGSDWICVRVHLCVHVSTHLLGLSCAFSVLHKVRGVATSFTRSSHVRKPLSVRHDDRREALAMDGALELKKINKNGAIVSEAMSRISAGV